MKDLKSAQVAGKRVLVRTDFNVPNFSSDQLRISRALPTLRYLVASGAKVIVLTHAKANDGRIPSLAPLARHLRKKYFKNLLFSPAVVGPEAAGRAKKMENGDILLLENVRRHRGEEACDKKFAAALASLGDVYVNEAFPESHRKYASIVLLPMLLPAYPGFLFVSEIEHLSRAFRPPHPFMLVVGGGKIETKIPLIKSFLKSADRILIGGVSANVFLEKPPLRSPKILLPPDGVVRAGGGKKVLAVEEISGKRKIWDIGPSALVEWEAVLSSAKLIVWNGPLGYIEKGFTEGTRRLFTILARSRANVIVGGGDTLSMLPRKIPRHVFVSTGGGAMLEFLANKTLPGIEALK